VVFDRIMFCGEGTGGMRRTSIPWRMPRRSLGRARNRRANRAQRKFNYSSFGPLGAPPGPCPSVPARTAGRAILEAQLAFAEQRPVPPWHREQRKSKYSALSARLRALHGLGPGMRERRVKPRGFRRAPAAAKQSLRAAPRSSPIRAQCRNLCAANASMSMPSRSEFRGAIRGHAVRLARGVREEATPRDCGPGARPARSRMRTRASRAGAPPPRRLAVQREAVPKAPASGESCRVFPCREDHMRQDLERPCDRTSGCSGSLSTA